MIIQTERLVLRSFSKMDIKWYYDFVQNEEFQKRLPGLIVENYEQAISDIELFEKGDFINDFYYVITDKAGNVIGVIVGVRISPMTIDVSYFLSKEYRHNGYMHEALKCLVTTARRENPVYQFRMVVDCDNTDSLNVLKKIGARVQENDNKYICYM